MYLVFSSWTSKDCRPRCPLHSAPLRSTFGQPASLLLAHPPGTCFLDCDSVRAVAADRAYGIYRTNRGNSATAGTAVSAPAAWAGLNGGHAVGSCELLELLRTGLMWTNRTRGRNFGSGRSEMWLLFFLLASYITASGWVARWSPKVWLLLSWSKSWSIFF